MKTYRDYGKGFNFLNDTIFSEALNAQYPGDYSVWEVFSESEEPKIDLYKIWLIENNLRPVYHLHPFAGPDGPITKVTLGGREDE